MIPSKLLIACLDRTGIVAAVASFLSGQGANIVESAQHTTDATSGTFFMRTAFHLDVLAGERPAFEFRFEESVARPFSMDWRFSFSDERKRLGILVSRQDHCLLDLLWRWQRDELEADIVSVISNHRDVEPMVRAAGVPFAHVPVRPGSKAAAEEQILALLAGRVDVLILARYMQILSGRFLANIAVPVINIHHSFLPAFVGADPYRQALERGVKLIGATAHYVIEELDAGPIIEQDVERVSHRHGLSQLERIGRDIERVVLARATAWHIDDRVITHGNRTFVFD